MTYRPPFMYATDLCARLAAIQGQGLPCLSATRGLSVCV
jgi:hypothetical protein